MYTFIRYQTDFSLLLISIDLKSFKNKCSHLIDVELALSSGQFSVTGTELSNKVMTGKVRRKGENHTKDNNGLKNITNLCVCITMLGKPADFLLTINETPEF